MARLVLLQVHRHAKVADLADAVVVQEDVSRRQVSVHDLELITDCLVIGGGGEQEEIFLTFLLAMYSIPLAMSCANPESLLGDKGIAELRTVPTFPPIE